MSPSATTPTAAPVPSSSSPRVGTDFFSPHARRSAPSAALGRGATAVRGLSVLDHAEFLERWGEVEMTRCQDGSNPMTAYYENTKFIL